MKPQMLPEEVAAMERILLSYGPHVDVLEWGSGGSTVYFTQLLRNKGISYTWTSVEYNKVWYERIQDLLKDDNNVKLALFDVGNIAVKQPDLPMNEYVAYPATLGKKYDIIFVDGRKRRRCLLEASHLLKPGGVALLHDARRAHCHSAFSVYPDSRILLWTGLWQGNMENPGLIQKVINSILYWCFRVYVFSFRLRYLLR